MALNLNFTGIDELLKLGLDDDFSEILGVFDENSYVERIVLRVVAYLMSLGVAKEKAQRIVIPLLIRIITSFQVEGYTNNVKIESAKIWEFEGVKIPKNQVQSILGFRPYSDKRIGSKNVAQIITANSFFRVMREVSKLVTKQLASTGKNQTRLHRIYCTVTSKNEVQDVNVYNGAEYDRDLPEEAKAKMEIAYDFIDNRLKQIGSPVRLLERFRNIRLRMGINKLPPLEAKDFVKWISQMTGEFYDKTVKEASYKTLANCSLDAEYQVFIAAYRNNQPFSKGDAKPKVEEPRSSGVGGSGTYKSPETGFKTETTASLPPLERMSSYTVPAELLTKFKLLGNDMFNELKMSGAELNSLKSGSTVLVSREDAKVLDLLLTAIRSS